MCLPNHIPHVRPQPTQNHPRGQFHILPTDTSWVIPGQYKLAKLKRHGYLPIIMPNWPLSKTPTHSATAVISRLVIPYHQITTLYLQLTEHFFADHWLKLILAIYVNQSGKCLPKLFQLFNVSLLAPISNLSRRLCAYFFIFFTPGPFFSIQKHCTNKVKLC